MREQSEYQKRHWSKNQDRRRSPSHPVVRALFEPRADFIASLVEDPASSSVLDVGCGNGFLTVPLERRFGRAAGVDLSPAMLRVNPCRETRVAAATQLPYVRDEFDVVVESHLLHHLDAPQRETAIREMARVARRAVVLYEPNRSNPLMFAFGAFVKAERMSLVFSRDYLRCMLEKVATQVDVRAEGMIVPNRSPAFWIPAAKILARTPLLALGFYLRAVALVERRR